MLEARKKRNKPKTNTNNLFENIKSKYILKIVFDNLIKKKLLSIIKYNCNLKNKFDINIEDYKNYL